MRHRVVVSLLILMGAGAGALTGAMAGTRAGAGTAASAAAEAGEPVTIGSAHRIHSTVLNEDRDYQVYLPVSYVWAQDRRYPVLYVLDGQTHFVHTVGSVSYLASHGEIPEMIVVAISSTVRVRDFTQTDWPQMWVGGGGAGNFKRFLSSELIPEIEKSYRADGYRILSGHSASGQFVLYCLTAEPALFKAYIALSPSLDWDDRLPQRSLEKSLEATPVLKSFLYVARSDDAGQPLADYDNLVATLQAKAPKGFRWVSRPFPDETHGSIALLGYIDALRSLYSGYRYHNDLLDQGLAAAQKHFDDLSRVLDWPMPIPEEILNGLAYEALAQGKTDDAIALFRRNLDASPNSASAWDGLADGYAKAERWREAAQASERALELNVKYDLPNRAYFEKQVKKMNAQLEKPVPK